jgi:glycosyltransferase involved in cell wall biosynthesis
MQLTAVMCTRNRPDLIGQAVRSVLTNTHPNFDLVIIDQSDTDATREALADEIAQHSKLRYVHTTRVGLSAAYNTAIEMSTGQALAFTDDDCIAPPDWLERIEAIFTSEKDVELLYGQVVRPAQLRGTGGVVPTLTFKARERIGGGRPFRVCGMGANFAARRRLFTAIGGFDEVLGGGGPLRSSQDFDFQYRVYRAGFVTLLTPDVTVDHYGLRTDQEWPQTLLAYGTGNGAFYTKHIRCGDLLAARLFAGEAARMTARRIYRRLRGRPDSWHYLRGMAQGLQGSFRFSVDRNRRLYVGRS